MKAPPRRATVHGAAKINMGWRVGARREDGYHEVSGLLQSISLTDRLAISTDAGEGAGEGVGFCFDVRAPVTLKVVGSPELESADNLICRAVELIAERSNPLPTTIELEKRIPVAAGLGGGSADAAAALVGLNTVWAARLSASQLVEMGADIGSDVPAMLVGGLVHASGRGERTKRVGSYTDGWVVIGISEERVSAAAAYEALDRMSHADGASSPALHHNDLERATLELVPGLRDRLEAMRDVAGVAFVSGSGPAVIGVVDSEDVALRVKSLVAKAFDEVAVAQPVDWGVRLVLGADSRQ